MNIGLVYYRYWPALGGAETQLHLLGRELARRHRVRAVVPANEGAVPPYRLGVFAPRLAPYTVEGVSVAGLSPSLLERLAGLPSLVYYLPRLRRWYYQELLAIGIAAYRRAFAGCLARRLAGVDVVYCVALNHLGWAALDAARALGRPFVLKPLVHPGQYGDDAQSMQLAREADAVIALVEEEKRFYVERGVPADKIHVIGIAPILAPERDPQGFRARHRIAGPLVAFVGRQSAYKGVPELVAAVERLRAAGTPVTLALAGPREDGLAFAGGAVLDLGPVDEPTKTSLVAAADVLALPSRHEILPSAILEAWSLAKPVVAGDIPYLRALVSDGEDGLLVPTEPAAIAAALARLLADPAAAARMGEAGRRKVAERYALDRVVGQTEALLEGLVVKPGP